MTLRDTSGENSDVYRSDVDTSDVDERKLMRRIDWHVVPWLAVLYLLNFLDRGSIGNAKVSSADMTSSSDRSRLPIHSYTT